MSTANHNVVKAHSFARQAEEALENKQWEAAVHLYQQAADLFLLATNDTSDVESIKALQLLSNAQANKSKALLRYVQHFNARSAEVSHLSSVSTEKTSNSSEPMEEISLSASENYFIGQSPPSGPSSTRDRNNLPVRQEEKLAEKKSVPSDLWGWMERMMEILYLPDSLKPTNSSNEVSRNSSLMSSFYIVPDQDDGETRSTRFQLDGGDAAPPIPVSSSGRDSEVKELDLKVKDLEEKIKQLTEENLKFKNKLQVAYADRLEVSKENDVMKRSILQFRQEFRKKAHQLRDISSSVGHLPSLDLAFQQREQQLEETMQQMRLQIDQLQMQLNAANQKSARQSDLIQKYEEQLRKYVGQFHIRETMSSSPPDSSLTTSQILDSIHLSSVDTQAPFEPDESLTNSQILQ